MTPAAAEWLIIGAVLDAEAMKISPRELVEASGLCGADFSDPRTRSTWLSITSLAEHKRPVSASTVFMAARAAGQLAEHDLATLQTLQARNAVTREQFKQLAETFRHAARGQQVAQRLRQMADDLEQRRVSPSTISGSLEGLAANLTSQWAPDHRGDEDLHEVLGEWDHAGQPGGRPLVVPTGIEALDAGDLKFRGWAPNLNLVIGQPSVGKSAVEAACIIAALRAGRRPGIFGIEDGTKWLTRRFIAAELGIAVADVGTVPYTEEQAGRIQGKGQEWSELLRNLITFKSSHVNADELIRRSVHWIRNEGVTEIWVDHLGQISHRRQYGEDTRHAIGRTLLNIRAAGERYQTPMIVLAHTSRPDPKDREERPPLMTEIAESAIAERSAYKIIGLWRKNGEMRATILKNKDGRRDVTVGLNVFHDAALVDAAGGEVVDLGKERGAERAAREAEREERLKKVRAQRFEETQERKRKAARERAREGRLFDETEEKSSAPAKTEAKA
jgi:replicative DNA helicase